MGKTHKRVPHRATAAGKTRSDTEVGKGEFRVSMEEEERGREMERDSRRQQKMGGSEGGGGGAVRRTNISSRQPLYSSIDGYCSISFNRLIKMMRGKKEKPEPPRFIFLGLKKGIHKINNMKGKSLYIHLSSQIQKQFVNKKIIYIFPF